MGPSSSGGGCGFPDFRGRFSTRGSSSSTADTSERPQQKVYIVNFLLYSKILLYDDVRKIQDSAFVH